MSVCFMIVIATFSCVIATYDSNRNILMSQNLLNEPMYADLYHSTNPAAAVPPSELEPVQYADIKKPVKR